MMTVGSAVVSAFYPVLKARLSFAMLFFVGFGIWALALMLLTMLPAGYFGAAVAVPLALRTVADTSTGLESPPVSEASASSLKEKTPPGDNIQG